MQIFRQIKKVRTAQGEFSLQEQPNLHNRKTGLSLPCFAPCAFVQFAFYLIFIQLYVFYRWQWPGAADGPFCQGQLFYLSQLHSIRKNCVCKDKHKKISHSKFDKKSTPAVGSRLVRRRSHAGVQNLGKLRLWQLQLSVLDCASPSGFRLGSRTLNIKRHAAKQ